MLSFGLLGVWEAALETIALLAISVSLALLIGIPLGIWAGRRPKVERVLRPILDAMQTIPAYSYLLPFVLLFGIGIRRRVARDARVRAPAGDPSDRARRP